MRTDRLDLTVSYAEVIDIIKEEMAFRPNSSKTSSSASTTTSFAAIPIFKAAPSHAFKSSSPRHSRSRLRRLRLRVVMCGEIDPYCRYLTKNNF